jgi:RNA polymerase sigma-70 factor (ECF subfamily)
MVTEVEGGPIARQDDRLGELELLYRESAVRLARAIYAFSGGRRQVAEDAVAEAFARAIAHRDSIRVPLAWIYRTAFRIASRELQRERRSLAAPPDPVPGIDPGEVLEVLQALAILSPNQRAAVVLHDEEGMSTREVADALGIAPATVRVHLFRGRHRLRNLLGVEENPDE